MKKVLSILMMVCLLFSLCACDFAKDVADSAINSEDKAKTFDFEGISIELTTDFLRMDFISEDYDFVVGDDELTVMGIRMLNSDTGMEEFSVLEFAQNFRSLMEEQNPTRITEIDDIPTMQYNSTDSGEEQTVAVMFYKGQDCFWAVCFVTMTDDFHEKYSDICKYAKTVKCE